MRYFLFLFAIAFIISCSEDSTNPDNKDNSQPHQLEIGNCYTSSQFYDDNLLTQTKDTVIDIGTPDEPIPLLVNKSFKKFDDDIEDINYAKETDIRTFLQNIWDPYLNGVEDEGVNGKEFNSALEKYGINGHVFLDLYNQSKLDITEYMELIEIIRSSVDQIIDGNQEIYEYLHFLINAEMNLEEFLIALESSGISTSVFFSNLGQNNINFKDLYELYYQNVIIGDLSLAEFFNQVNGGIIKNIKDKTQGNAYVEATKLAWDILKDTKPVVNAKGLFTSVLSTEDTNWEHYYSCKSFSSKTHRWLLEDIFTIHLVDISFKILGYHKCKHDSVKGEFISDAEVSFTNTYALLGWSASGSVGISHVSNIGTLDDLNPSIRFSVTLKATCLQSISKTWHKTITGH